MNVYYRIMKWVFLLFAVIASTCASPLVIDGTQNLIGIYDPQGYTSVTIDSEADPVALQAVDDVTIFHQNFSVTDLETIAGALTGLRVLQVVHSEVTCNLDLNSLKTMSELVYLNLADNRLKTLVFTDPEDTGAAWSSLQRLDLSDNHLEDITTFITSGAFARLPNLRILDLSDNRMLTVAGISELSSYNALTALYLDHNRFLSTETEVELPALTTANVAFQKIPETDCSAYQYKNYLWDNTMCTYETLEDRNLDPFTGQGISTPCCDYFELVVNEKVNGYQALITDLQNTRDELIALGVCHLSSAELLGNVVTTLDQCCDEAYTFVDSRVEALDAEIVRLHNLLASITRVGMCDSVTDCEAFVKAVL